MPWHIEKRGDEYCVIKDDDDENEGCHETREEAEDQMAALYASEDGAMAEVGWRGVVGMEGLTDDGRWYKSLTWRDLPLTLTLHHMDDEVVGRVDTLTTHAGGIVVGTGVFLASEDGAKAAQLVEDEALRWMSMEVIGDYEFVCTAYEDFGYGPECTDGLAVFEDAVIVRVAVVGAGAFEATVMELVPAGETDEEASAAIERMVVEAARKKPPEPDLVVEVVQASLAVPTDLDVPVVPPLAWFSVDEPDEVVPLHIEPDGRIVGHIAPGGECHVGIHHECVTAPESWNDYAYFNLGRIIAVNENGEHVEVKVGQVTMTTGHGDRRMGLHETVSHYDNTGAVVGYIRVSNGVHGLWACGTAKHGITPAQVVEFNAAKPSGHWVPIHGHNELVAVLMVNSPGFPVVASFGRLREDGTTEPQGMILSLPSYDSRRRTGIDDVAQLRVEVARLQSVVAALVDSTPGVWDSLAASIR